MYAHVEKPKEHKSRAVANSGIQKKGDTKQAIGLADNRSSVIQRMLWTWDGSKWTPSSPTVNASPTFKGKTYGQTYDDGLGGGAVVIVPPPIGYTLETDSTGSTAYVANANGYTIGSVALNHIVAVAHTPSNAHRSSKMRGTRIPTYVHPSDDELYTVTIQGNHTDGIPKITVHELGKVRGGLHKFN